MKLLRKLRLRSVLRLARPVGLIFCLCLPVLILLTMEVFEAKKEPVGLYDVPADELEQQRVTAEIPIILGQSGYTEETRNDKPTGKIVSKDYLIYANEHDLCFLVLPDELIEQGDRLCAESEKYLNGEITEIQSELTVTGTMRALNGERAKTYQPLIEELGDGYYNILPLYLDAEAKNQTNGTVFVLCGMGVAFLLPLLIFALLAANGRYQKQLTEKVSQLAGGNTEETLERVQQAYDSAQKYNGVRIGSGLVFAESGVRHYLYKLDELVWVYGKTVKQAANTSVSLGAKHCFVLNTMDGQHIEVPMKKKVLETLLVYLYRAAPNCVIGYRDGLQKIFWTDRMAMRSIAEAQRNR